MPRPVIWQRFTSTNSCHEPPLWRDSTSTRRTYGTPGGGVAIAARTPASAATTFGGEADSDDESVAVSEAPSGGHFGGPKDPKEGSSPTNATIAEHATQLADSSNEQLGAMTGLGTAMAQITANLAEMKHGGASKTKGSTVGFSMQPGKQRKGDMSA